MAKIVVELKQAEIVSAFRKSGLPVRKFAGFEDGYKAAFARQAENAWRAAFPSDTPEAQLVIV